MCFFDSVELADGRMLSVNGPRGAGPAAAPAVATRSDIFGTWLLAPMANRSTSGPQPMITLLTPAGEKAVAAYDPFKDDPTFRCDPVAIRRVWGAPGTPLEIVRDGSDVVLRHEWMDVRRVIHMNLKAHPKDAKRGSLGHSIGHWEGDTLVIETANYSAGVLNQYVEQPGQPTRGLLHSAALTSVERLRLDAGASASGGRDRPAGSRVLQAAVPALHQRVRAVGPEDRAVQLLAGGRDGDGQEDSVGAGFGGQGRRVVLRAAKRPRPGVRRRLTAACGRE